MHFKSLLYFLSFFLIVFSVASCLDQDFDEPPVANLPNLTANATIADLKALHTIGTEATLVDDSLVIEAVVTADDQSGNFFRQIAIEDETGGIILRLNATGLFNLFPVGRQVFVNCKGLYIGDFNGLPQINGSPEDAIEELLISQYVIGGRFDQPVDPTPVAIDAITDELTGSLIELNEVQFVAGDTAVAYADAVNRVSINRTLEDCDGNTIIVRTSGYADFASVKTPTGNGRLLAVLTVFGDTRQLVVRDPIDVTLTGTRCEGSGSGGGDLMPIAEVRQLYLTGTTEGPADRSIRGIVISDRNAGNIDVRNLVLQDGSGGIVVRFQDAHSFNLGEELEVTIEGVELSEFNGLLQVNFVPNGNAFSRGSGSLPTPRPATVQEVLTNSEAWESTLVRIEEATISGNGTFNGSATVSDATGSIPMFTRSAANFAQEPLPSGTVTLTAIVGDFNGPQLNIRNLSDIDGGGSGGDPETISMTELRNLYEGGAGIAPAGRKIRGVVISDADHENITGRNIVIQDASGGLVVRFEDFHNFALGEEVEVVVGGRELSEFNGLFQVNNVPNSNATSFGNGTLPEPRTATIEAVIANLEAWESTLVRIENVTISGGSVFDGLLTLNDGTGTLGMFTRGQATFASASVPSGAITLIGIVSQFNDPQITIRNLDDINP